MRLPFIALALLLAIAPVSAADAPLQLTLPPQWYGVQGIPMSLYFDNVVLTEHPENYKFEVTCDIGTADAKHWTITPTEQQAGTHAMQVIVKDSTGKVLEQAATGLHIAPAKAGATKELKLLVVGDSLTHASFYPNEIARLLSSPGNPRWMMLGTHKPENVAKGVAHEGYGGWKWSDFLSKYVAKPKDDKKSSGSSPFIFLDGKGKPALNILRYFTDKCESRKPDVVTFLLGINDCFGAKTDDPAAMLKTIDGVLDNAEKLIAAFHAASPKTVFAVGLTTPPNARQSGFTANYKDKYTRWGWKRIQHRLVQRMLERFGNRTQDQIYLVPTELNLDTVAGYPDNNGVHPNPAGYAQIGTSFYAWMKNWLAK